MLQRQSPGVIGASRQSSREGGDGGGAGLGVGAGRGGGGGMTRRSAQDVTNTAIAAAARTREVRGPRFAFICTLWNQLLAISTPEEP
jgi:hypothetical protein